MKTHARRERAFAQREAEFLDLARRMIAEGGLAGFNMDRLTEATEYSKGTLYQHFKSKEDLLTALAVQSQERRVAWFDRASRHDGGTRERMVGLALAEEIFVTLRPLHFRSELLIKLSDFAERAAPERVAELDRLEARCGAVVGAVVADGVRAGDLALAPGRTAGEVECGFIALHIGAFTMMHNFRSLHRAAGVTDPLRALRYQFAAYLDGLGWRPLSGESDPAASYRRILASVFPDESREAGLTG